MGCRNSKLKENAVIAIPNNQHIEPAKVSENNALANEEVSEFSLRECSLIPIVVEGQRRRTSEDPSMMGFIQELQ